MSKRQYLTPDQKVAIVRRLLLEKQPISNLCDEYGVHATQIYTWQRQLFENAAPIFERRREQGERASARRCRGQEDP